MVDLLSIINQKYGGMPFCGESPAQEFIPSLF